MPHADRTAARGDLETDAPAPARPVESSGAAVVRLQRTAGNAATARAAQEGTLAAVDVGRYERAYGADLGDVRFHADSSCVGGAAQAVTKGPDVHFAPGRLDPGSEAGDRLIGHELAHVVQQRRTGEPAPALAAELDADAAADAAVAGSAFRPQAAAVTGRAQAFEAWEHRQLGDADGGAGRRIRLPNGIELTYGQIVALSGDFYRSPEALMRAPRQELEGILAVMDRERSEASASPTHAPDQGQVNANNADYEMATTGHSRSAYQVPALGGDADAAGGAHGEVREGEHVESGAPGADAGFLDLAGDNAAHFSPENIRLNWIPKHQLALDLARQAWQARHPGATPPPIAGGDAPSARAGTLPAAAAAAPGLPATAAAAAAAAPGRPDPSATPTAAGTASADFTAPEAEQHEAQAWLAAAFSDHYLTDAFASGHLISGSVGRRICQSFYDANDMAIATACWSCAVADGMPPDAAAAVTGAFRSFLAGKASSLLLKTVHDYYNRNGIDVRNALGQEWKTLGDANLGGSPETIAMAELGSKASRDAVQDVLTTGGTGRAQAALDYIPDMAKVAATGYLPIDAFSSDPAAWDPLLRRALSHSPAENDLYQ
ncbi:MAG: hypothetical protein QOE28_1506, partial [Solirubrobacteraceae bacterium]|nr:hypothetical protein [Solirubrobacteraceae bacterium]